MDPTDSLPSAPDAEKGLLGSILLAPNRIMDLCDERKVDDLWFFPNEDHAKVLRYLRQMRRDRVPIDLITCAQYFVDRQKEIGLSEPNPHALFAELFTFVSTAASADYYLDILQEKAAQREAIKSAISVQKSLHEACTLQETYNLTTGCFQKAQELCVTEEKFDLKKQAILDFFDEVDAASKPAAPSRFIPTPFPTINAKAGGYSPSELVVISGPKGSGKSLAASQSLCTAVFDQNKGAAVFGLEMPTRQYIRRMVSYMGKISHRNMKFGKMTEHEFKRFGPSLHKIEKAPLEFFDFTNCQMTLSDIERKIRLCHRTVPGFGFAVIDYLQLIRTTSKADKRRDQELSEVTTRGKQLCNELGINIMILCAENYDGKIRESGGVEYDCDTRFQIRINKTTEQPEKLWIDKMRDGEAKYSIPIEMVGDLCLLREPVKESYSAPDF